METTAAPDRAHPSPLVALRAIGAGLYGKLEFQHLSGSIKHRSIPPFLADLRHQGRLPAGRRILIHSAGAAAVTTAWAGARLGCGVDAVIPESTAPGVVRLLGWLGARCHRKSSRQARSFMRQVERESGAYVLDQFRERALIDHYRAIAGELVTQLPEITAVVVGIGTGVSITGIGREIRDRAAGCRVVGVEPEECQVAAGKPWRPHKISGLAPPVPQELLDHSVIDEIIPVPSKLAWSRARELSQRHGLLVGPSSGATLEAALRLRRRAASGQVVAILSGTVAELLDTGTEVRS